ncbi:MAG: bifunctional glutamate N-acetyltransferase/amino-acid acetyltransferase ArgJ [Planctomycetes bacterium]|nr:bifunctional glutamate N-acetyltransferase/amino-acid acetyltransferase ArgJ [Planctomycetota bacterium]MCB9870878.1 bifunctional glutamate N-acetyltransferase/amino-acid acetyltransferase ArgJ [Planctomycetota bacterium]
MTEPIALPPGFRAAGLHAGIKKNGKPDLGVLIADHAYPAYAMFTQNHLLGAHIPVCREHLSRSGGQVRAVLVNSGNANCATGSAGIGDNRAVCRAVADHLGCPIQQVLFLSTGVIGARLPVAVIVDAVPGLCDRAHEAGAREFAEAIMTTDTHPKLASEVIHATDGAAVQVTGIAKGAGMIHPDMATLLAFLVTEGRSEADLAMGLRAIADQTFHRVTIDGDTSPNDTLLLWTAARHWCRPTADEHGLPVHPLEDSLTRAGRSLARMIARDGEGATRLVTVQVRGCMSDQDTLDLGRFVATSPLVKTAVFGRDPNWGRILSAAGACGLPIDIERARVWIGDAELFSEGKPHPQNEAAARQHLLDQEDVVLGIDAGMGPFCGEVWTCDFSDRYVSINADYRS